MIRKPDADKAFIEGYYGNNENFRAGVQNDFCMARFNWFCYIDGLCKSGEITPKQYRTWAFPGDKYRKWQ